MFLQHPTTFRALYMDVPILKSLKCTSTLLTENDYLRKRMHKDSNYLTSLLVLSLPVSHVDIGKSITESFGHLSYTLTGM